MNCSECGGEVVEDASVGVYLHASDTTPDGIDWDMDRDHVALPNLEPEYEVEEVAPVVF